ncbi:ABC transporter permease [Allokutzneria sp. A3M-2-11 16]|uniref:ABC transporter permease n=1 Tax=Allokutzneria sp. A3M-2-11 16 TaxID=2962043 RepID=UPI0020B78264|nr:ABC transporter permease [Allokutzneria sp. A3M-2-11 16]MCP3798765.1 ABC transporter permease [Allokutzneria sp. A3M-2-11 16]
MKLLHDSWLVCARAMRPLWRSPMTLAFAMFQPVLFLVLFGPLLQPLGDRFGAPDGNSWQFFVPGLLVQLAILSPGMAGFGVIFEHRSGVIERMRVTPLSRTALLLGRVAKDAVTLIAQSALLVVAGALFGLRASVPGALLGLLLIGLVAIALAAVSNAVALRMLDREWMFAPTMSQISVLVVLLSGLLLPMSLAPDWLRWLSMANPLSYVVDAERALFAGRIADPVVLTGSLVAVALTATTVLWGTRTYQRQDS